MVSASRVVVALAVLSLSLSGCLGGPGQGDAVDGGAPTATDASPWTGPVRVDADGHGFEPSVRAGPGFVVVAAARGFEPRPDGSLASPVWRSDDDGATWMPLTTPAGLRDRLETQEGDLGVDADGTVYFVDTHGGDAHVTAWDRTGAWLRTTPLGSLGLDDRPWLAAHGSGVVYLLSNGLAKAPLPESPDAGAVGVYRSVDGGLTWSLGRALPAATACGVAASPLDDRTVVAVCHRTAGVGYDDGSAPDDAVVFWSTDRGASWRTEVLAGLETPAPGFPSVGFTDAGRVVAAWGEEGGGAGDGGRVRIASAPGVDGPWKVTDLPSPRPVGNVWACAGGRDAWGVTYAVGGGAGWTLTAGVTDGDAEALRPVAVQEEPISDGPEPPVDFHQCDVDADGRMHVAYQHGPSSTVPPFLKPVRGEVRWARSG